MPQLSLIPNDVSPITVNCPFTFATTGPPESPGHVVLTKPPQIIPSELKIAGRNLSLK